MSVSAVVIVGAGQGGYQTAASLRQAGFTGSITLVNDEPGLPYQRPPLSKAYLLGKLDATRLLLRQEAWYADQEVDLVEDRVVAIDRAGHEIHLATGATLPYDHLVLATGARNRTLAVPGAELDGVIGMRTKGDADRLASRVHADTNVVVVGAGFIGLEFAAVAAALGASVHVLELADRPMARAVSKPTSEFFRAAHEAWNVTFDFNQGLEVLEGEAGHVREAVTSGRQRLRADLVVYGIGVVPNVELAELAGLATGNGITVDAHLLTDDPDISAVGDAVTFPCTHADGALMRLESVQNAADQARSVAARLMGNAAAYEALPWFWSDQGDLKLQIAGIAQGHDQAVELDVDNDRQKIVLCFKDDVLIAVETVNRPGDHMIARRILVREHRPTVAEASAPGFGLKEWEQSHALSTAP